MTELSTEVPTGGYCSPAQLNFDQVEVRSMRRPSENENAIFTRYILSAAAEINALLGIRFVVPISLQNALAGQPNHATKLFLETVNRQLAEGRFIAAMATAASQEGTHGYANKLINGALKAASDCAGGKGNLPGAMLIDASANAPMIVALNPDAFSPTEAFYQQATDGMGFAARTPRYWEGPYYGRTSGG